MNELSKREIELIKETVTSTIDSLMEKVIPEAIKAHIAKCPAIIAMFKVKWSLFGGVIIGVLLTVSGDTVWQKIWNMLHG